uniref:AB hydrolase-1 domain-containing protein n=1 Tax=Sinocyclocheilus rhinocerous TaxID=307959 RepID=A0A673N416_9TELE
MGFILKGELLRRHLLHRACVSLIIKMTVMGNTLMHLLLLPTRLSLLILSLVYYILVYATAGITWRGIHTFYLFSRSVPPIIFFLVFFTLQSTPGRYQLQKFSSHYHTVALDLRGCGDSDAPVRLEEYSLETLFCILMGHDWGGMLAWHFALDRPDMVQLLIVMHAPHPASWLGKCSCIGSKSILWQEFGPSELLPFSSQHQDVSVPCMLIWGEADNILVEDMSGGTRPYVRGPVVIHTIPECSHWVQQDQPEKVNKLIWDFVLDKDIIKHNQ